MPTDGTDVKASLKIILGFFSVFFLGLVEIRFFI